MLAVQMVATHGAAVRALRLLKTSENIPQQDSNGNLAVKLMRTFTAQVEALQRYRGKGHQKVTVEHAHVHAGGQAVVGIVENPGRRSQRKSEDQSDEKQIAHAPQPALHGRSHCSLDGGACRCCNCCRVQSVCISDKLSEVGQVAEGWEVWTIGRVDNSIWQSDRLMMAVAPAVPLWFF